MRTYYFNTKDGIPARRRTALEFPTPGGAIEYSRELARRLRHDPRIRDRTLTIVVMDETGAEVHCEPVHPDVQIDPAADKPH
jgi:hypothetical protein